MIELALLVIVGGALALLFLVGKVALTALGWSLRLAFLPIVAAVALVKLVLAAAGIAVALALLAPIVLVVAAVLAVPLAFVALAIWGGRKLATA